MYFTIENPDVKMIEQLNKLYEKEVEDNKVLKSWIDKLADFILINKFLERENILEI